MHDININENYAHKNINWSDASLTQNLSRHRWYYYKEGFSPNIVEQAIKESNCANNDLIIDPFNGSGTVTLVASIDNIDSVGYEVNPFSAFLSECKLIQVDVNELEYAKKIIVKGILKGKQSPLEGFSTFSSGNKNKKWFFSKTVLNSFEGGWHLTDDINTKISKLLKLCLINAAMDNCNATRDGKCLRYRKTWNTNKFNTNTFLKSFENIYSEVKEDLLSKTLKKTGTIICGDSRNLISRRKDKFKLCITSPPYLNSFDYTDIYRPELFLGKFVNTFEELRELRYKTVRSHVQVQWKEPNKNDYGFLYNDCILKITKEKDNLWNNRIPSMISAYFEDMEKMFIKLKDRAVPDASLWVIVSNSAYAGIEVPVDLILAEIGSQSGWYLKEIGVLRYLRKRKSIHSDKINQLRESVIIFNNSK